MNRRAFLTGLVAAAAGATLDPERLFWKPGKVISVPPRVHVPQLHAIALTVAHDPVRWDGDTMPAAYQKTWLNATAALQTRVRELEERAGGVRAQYLHNQLPNVDIAAEIIVDGMDGVDRIYRNLIGYSAIHDRVYQRVDCTVRI